MEEEKGKSKTQESVEEGAAKGLSGLLLEFCSEQLAQCCELPGLSASLKLGYGKVAETEKAKSFLKNTVEEGMPKATKWWTC